MWPTDSPWVKRFDDRNGADSTCPLQPSRSVEPLIVLCCRLPASRANVLGGRWLAGIEMLGSLTGRS